MSVAVLPIRRRKHKTWIDDLVQFTSYSNSPEIHRKWTAISTIGAALQRRCYILIQGEPLFCNLYTVLVGPPGVGKTRSIRIGQKLLSQVSDLALSPDAVTQQKFLGLLSAATKVVPANGEMLTQTAYACFLDELSTFIKARDVDFMTVLTNLYDCPKVYSYQTLGRGDCRLENVFITICGGITPKSIQRNWGEDAIGMGFTARLNMIFSEDTKPINLFSISKEPDFTSFVDDLREIYDMQGAFRVTEDAARELQTWVSAGMPPMPADTRFAEYNPRRSIHWLKLCMAYSAAESSDLIITRSHVEAARQTLLEAESFLPLCFEHLGQNPMLSALNSTHQWLKIEYGVSKAPIPESRIRRKLLADVPPQYIEAALNELLNSGMMKLVASSAGKAYVPIMIRRDQ